MAIIGPPEACCKYQSMLDEHLSAERIESLATACGHRWRERALGPAVTVHLWVMQVLLRNLSLAGVRHLCRQAVTASAVCQAKARLPRQLLERLNQALVDALCPASVGEGSAAGRWRGHRIFGGDGACYYTADTPTLRGRFKSKKPFGFPLLKAVTLFDLASGALIRQVAVPHRRQEGPLLQRLLRHLRRGDVLVLDRAYASYANLCDAVGRGTHLVARLKRNLFAAAGTRRTARRCPGRAKGDLSVVWRKPKERPAMVSRWRWSRLPAELVLRQVTVDVRRRGWRVRRITVLSTLTDPAAYPAAEIAQLYARRWEVETNFRHLKQTLDLEHLQSQTAAGVAGELLVRSIAYNLVRAAMGLAARVLGVDPARVSFADTLNLLLLGHADLGVAHARVNPERPGRSEPRRLKRQNKNYLPLNCSRAEARRKAA